MDARLLDGWESTGVHFSSDQQNGETDWDSFGPSLRLGHALVLRLGHALVFRRKFFWRRITDGMSSKQSGF